MHNLRISQVFDILFLPRCFNISRFPSCLQRLGSHISNRVFSSKFQWIRSARHQGRTWFLRLEQFSELTKCTLFIPIQQHFGVTFLMTCWKFVRCKCISQFEVPLLKAQRVYLIYSPVSHIRCHWFWFYLEKTSRLMSTNIGFSKHAHTHPTKNERCVQVYQQKI